MRSKKGGDMMEQDDEEKIFKYMKGKILLNERRIKELKPKEKVYETKLQIIALTEVNEELKYILSLFDPEWRIGG